MQLLEFYNNFTSFVDCDRSVNAWVHSLFFFLCLLRSSMAKQSPSHIFRLWFIRRLSVRPSVGWVVCRNKRSFQTVVTLAGIAVVIPDIINKLKSPRPKTDSATLLVRHPQMQGNLSLVCELLWFSSTTNKKNVSTDQICQNSKESWPKNVFSTASPSVFADKAVDVYRLLYIVKRC